jgi:hypothetical protein
MVVIKDLVMFATDRRGLKIALALLIAPLVSGLLLLSVSAFGNLGEGVWALRLSALVGYPAMIVLGLPAHLLLARRGWTSLWKYMLAGLLVGAVVYAVLFSDVVVNNLGLSAHSEQSPAPSAAILLLIAFFGVLSSTVFWLIVRPDRH